MQRTLMPAISVVSSRLYRVSRCQISTIFSTLSREWFLHAADFMPAISVVSSRLYRVSRCQISTIFSTLSGSRSYTQQRTLCLQSPLYHPAFTACQDVK